MYDFSNDNDYTKKLTELLTSKNTLLDEQKQLIKDLLIEINNAEKDTTLAQDVKDENINIIKTTLNHKKKYFDELILNIDEQIKNYKKDYEAFINDKKGYTWDNDNIITIHKWKSECHKNQYVYSTTLNVLLKKSKKIKILMIILTALQSFIAISDLGINNDASQNLIWTIKILTSIISTLSFILTQYLTLQKYDDDIKNIADYLTHLELFLKQITLIINVKNELRPDGDKYITDNEKIYLDIQSKCPVISIELYQKYLSNYDKYLEENKKKIEL